MAFVQQNVNYAADYSRALAEGYPYLSYMGDIWGNEVSKRYKPGMGKTIYIPRLSTGGARTVDRDEIDGTFRRNWNNSLQAVSLEMDREWDTLVDPMDIDETDMVATIANITKNFNEHNKVPEMDAYLASKLYSFATPDTTSLSISNILGKWDGYLEALSNARVPRGQAISYVTPGVYKLLKQATGVNRYMDVSHSTGKVNRNMIELDGVPIYEVPADEMKSAYDFTEGWTPADGATQINMIVFDPEAVAAVVKHEVAMLSEPTAGSKGKWLYYERYYYGAWLMPDKANGIIVNAAAAN